MDIRVERAGAGNEAAVTLVEEYQAAVGVVARDSREQLFAYLSSADHAIWIASAGDNPAGCSYTGPCPPWSGRAK